MNGQVNQIFDFGQVSPIKYFFTVAFILGVLFAFISQGDDPNRGFIFTGLQWQLQTALPIALLILSHMLLSRFLKFEQINPWLQLLISGFLGVLFFCPFALLLDYWFNQDQFSIQQLPLQLLDELQGVGPPVLISWLAMNAPWILGYRINQPETFIDESNVQKDQFMLKGKASQEHLSANKTIETATLFNLLPTAIGKDIVYLKAELHYIEVNSSQGQVLILYNLKDAMQELAFLPGIQCHRSYWVNLKHVEQLKKQGRQGLLELSNDSQIPVSRTRLKAVTEACNSWLKKLH